MPGDPRPNSLFDALGEIEGMTVAGRQVVAGLRDADDRAPGLQLFPGQAVVEVALKVERRHARVVRIVEPELASKVAGFALTVAHHASVPVYEPNPALQLEGGAGAASDRWAIAPAIAALRIGRDVLIPPAGTPRSGCGS